MTHKRIVYLTWLQRFSAVVFGFLLLLGIWVRFSIPQWPIMAPDSNGYLLPAWGVLQGEPFTMHLGRSVFYPAFLWLCLSWGKSFQAIAMVQHVLGCVSMILWWYSWNRLRPRSITFMGSIIYNVLGWSGMAFLAFSMLVVMREAYIGPEGIFNFIVSLLIALMATGFKNPKCWKGLAIIFVGIAIYGFMPKWGLAVPLVSMIGSLVIYKGVKQHKIRTLCYSIGVMVFAGLVVTLPNKIVPQADDKAQTFLPEVLFFFHMPQITSWWQKEGLLETQPYALVYESYLAEIDYAKENKIRVPQTYDYSADRLIYGAAANQLKRTFENSTQYATFLKQNFLQGIIHAPSSYALKIIKQLNQLYTLPTDAFAKQYRPKYMSRMLLYNQTFKAMEGREERYQKLDIGGVYLQALNDQIIHPLAEQSLFLRAHRMELNKVIRVLNITYFPIVLFILSCGVWVVLCLLRRKESVLFQPVPLLIISVALLALGMNSTIAITHCLEFTRYRLFQHYLSLYTVLGGAWYLFNSLETMLKRKAIKH